MNKKRFNKPLIAFVVVAVIIASAFAYFTSFDRNTEQGSASSLSITVDASDTNLNNAVVMMPGGGKYINFAVANSGKSAVQVENNLTFGFYYADGNEYILNANDTPILLYKTSDVSYNSDTSEYTLNNGALPLDATSVSGNKLVFSSFVSLDGCSSLDEYQNFNLGKEAYNDGFVVIFNPDFAGAADISGGKFVLDMDIIGRLYTNPASEWTSSHKFSFETELSATEGSFDWSVDDENGIAYLEGIGTYGSTNLVIPSSVYLAPVEDEETGETIYRTNAKGTYYPTVIVRTAAFRGNTDITSVKYADNVSYENNSMYQSFKGCTSLKTMSNIPDSVTDMYGTFYDCTGMIEAPELPTSVFDLRYAFTNCSSLEGSAFVYGTVHAAHMAFEGAPADFTVIVDSCENKFPTISSTCIVNCNYEHIPVGSCPYCKRTTITETVNGLEIEANNIPTKYYTALVEDANNEMPFTLRDVCTKIVITDDLTKYSLTENTTITTGTTQTSYVMKMGHETVDDFIFDVYTELGHCYDFINTTKSRYALAGEWKNIVYKYNYIAGYDYFLEEGKTFIDKYMDWSSDDTSNLDEKLQEMFDTAVSAYFNDTEWLKTNCPEIYEFIWKLRIEVDPTDISNVPSLVFTGSQWFAPGTSLKGSNIKVELALENGMSSSIGAAVGAIGSTRTGIFTNGSTLFFYNGKIDSNRDDYKASHTISISELPDGPIIVEATPEAYYLNNEYIFNPGGFVLDSAQNVPFYIGRAAVTNESFDTGNSFAWSGRLYYIKLYINDTLYRYLYPAMDAYGVVCYYDSVNKEFLYNKGSGELNWGDPINGNVPMYSKDYNFLIYPNGTLVAVSGPYAEGDVILPDAVEMIDGRWQPISDIGDAYQYQEAITSITLPAGFGDVAEDAFEGCINLTEVKINDKISRENAYAIMRNNASIKHVYFKPYQYEVASITSSGTQFIDTGIAANDNVKVEVKYNQPTPSTALTTIFGVRDSSTTEFFFTSRYNSNDYNKIFGKGSSTNVILNNTYFDTDVIVVLDGNTVTITDGTNTETIVNDGSVSTTNSIYLFGYNQAGSFKNASKMSLYYAKLWENDTLVRDFIPVIDQSGVSCLFDKVSQELFYSTKAFSGVGSTVASCPYYEYCTPLMSSVDGNLLMDVNTNTLIGAKGPYAIGDVALPNYVEVESGEFIPIERIADNVYSDNPLLTSIVLPDTLIEIKHTTFNETTILNIIAGSDICFPESNVQTFFDNISSLNSIITPSRTYLRYYETEDGLKFNYRYKLVEISGDYAAGDVVLPEIAQCIDGTEIPITATTIGSIYRYNTDITSITFPNTISTISAYTLYGCSNLKEVNLPGCPHYDVGKSILDLLPNVDIVRLNTKFAALLSYIESTGTQYFNSGYIPTTNTKAEIKINRTVFADSPLFGSRYSTSAQKFAIFNGISTTVHKQFGTASTDYNIGYDITGKDTVFTLSKNGIYVDGKLLGTCSGTVESSYPIAILGLNNKGSIDERHPATKLYYFKIWEDNVLKQEFVPVLDHNGVACLFEAISGELYYPLGGDMKAGDVVHNGFVIRDYTTEDGLTINYRGEIIGVSGKYASGDVVIPESVTTPYAEIEITGMVDTIYQNNTEITSLNFPSFFENFTDGAFDGCTKLRTITLNANMYRSEAQAFFDRYPSLSKLIYKPAYSSTLSYFESTGTQYFNSGYVPTTETKAEIKFNRSTFSDTPLFGSRYSSSAQKFAVFNSGSTHAHSQYGAKSNTYTLSFDLTGIDATFTLSKDGLYVNGNLIGTVSGTNLSTYPMAILGMYNKTSIDSRKVDAKIYYFKIWESNELVREYIPAIDGNGVVCFYETIEDKFYYNLGTGDFGLGTITPADYCVLEREVAEEPIGEPVEEPIEDPVEDPVIEEPITEEPTITIPVEDPVVEEPVVEEPTPAEPVSVFDVLTSNASNASIKILYELSGQFYSSITEADLYRIFDGQIYTAWGTSNDVMVEKGDGDGVQAFGLKFAEAKTISKIKVCPAITTAYDIYGPSIATVQVSEDGITWTDVATVSDIDHNSTEPIVFDIDITSCYVRVQLTQNYTYMAISEIQFLN